MQWEFFVRADRLKVGDIIVESGAAQVKVTGLQKIGPMVIVDFDDSTSTAPIHGSCGFDVSRYSADGRDIDILQISQDGRCIVKVESLTCRSSTVLPIDRSAAAALVEALRIIGRMHAGYYTIVKWRGNDSCHAPIFPDSALTKVYDEYRAGVREHAHERSERELIDYYIGVARRSQARIPRARRAAAAPAPVATSADMLQAIRRKETAAAKRGGKRRK